MVEEDHGWVLSGGGGVQRQMDLGLREVGGGDCALYLLRCAVEIPIMFEVRPGCAGRFLDSMLVLFGF